MIPSIRNDIYVYLILVIVALAAFTVTPLAYAVRDNPPPVVEPIDDITVSAGETISFNVKATDIDTIGILQYYINPPWPPGVGDGREMINQNTGHFDWTPNEDQRGAYTLNLLVWDGQPRPYGRTYLSFDVAINGPVLAAIPTGITIPEHKEYTFDADFVAGISGHIFRLVDAPDGARIGPVTGVFSWTPSEEQGGQGYNFTVVAVDGDGATVDEQEVTITVDEANLPPVIAPIDDIIVHAGLEVSFSVNATDMDTDGSLQYAIVPPLPPGVADGGDILDRTTGHFDWTPDENQEGVHTINLRVWDGLPGNDAYAHQSFTITVQYNPAPVIEPIDDITASSGQRISFDVSAADEGTVDGLRYTLLKPLPPGVADGGDILDRDTGHFSWTPDESQEGLHDIKLRVWDGQPRHYGREHESFTITVNGPVLAGFPTGITIPEHIRYTFDADFVEGVSNHTFGLRNAPNGAKIDPETGVFIWKPFEEQGPEEHTFRITAINGSGVRVDEQTVKIMVTEYNPLPVLRPIKDKTVYLGDTVSFYVRATDVNTIGKPQYFLDPPLPPGVERSGEILNRYSGRFRWTPGELGVHTINLHAWDGYHNGRTYLSFNITVLANPPPVIEPIDDIVTPLGQRISFYVNATDAKTIGNLRYFLDPPLPPGVADGGDILDRDTGHFDWTPGEDQEGVHTINLRVWDGQSNGGNTRHSFNITVGDNPVPVIEPIDDITVSSGQRISFNVSATDVDTIGNLRYFLDPPLPPGVSDSREMLDRDTGHFDWTPGEDQEGVHTINLRVWDGQPGNKGRAHQSFKIIVNGPVLAAIPRSATIPEHEEYTFDADFVEGVSGHTFGVLDAPGGASIDPSTGVFSWTPSKVQGGTVPKIYSFRVTAIDGNGTTVDYQRVNIGVLHVNPPPVIEPIGDITVYLGQTASFYVNATDIDTYNSLQYFLESPLPPNPASEILDQHTGYFSWTPGKDYVGVNTIRLRVYDGHPDIGNTRVSFNITVMVNPPPIVEQIDDITVSVGQEVFFRVNATDVATLDSRGLNYILLDPLPPGENNTNDMLNWRSGYFRWTPDDDQRGVHALTLRVWDGQPRPHPNGRTDQSFTITVNGPILAVVPTGITIPEQVRYTFDADFVAGISGHTFGIVGGPNGSSIDPSTGVFSWTPAEDQGGRAYTFKVIAVNDDGATADEQEVVIAVTEHNSPPIVEPIENVVVSAGHTVSLYVRATDSETHGGLRHLLLDPLPPGVGDGGDILDRTTGQFEWTPNKAGVYPINLRVWDGQSGDRGSAYVSFNITVQENAVPDISPIDDIVVSSGQRISFYVNATDIDTFGGLRYLLLELLPPGVSDGREILDRDTGHFDWTPDEDQTGIHTINLLVWDGQSGENGRAHYSFKIIVHGPILAAIPTGIIIPEHIEYTFDADLAEGADVPGHTFGLLDAPDGAEIDPSTGVFSWTPSEDQGGKTYTFKVTAINGTGAIAGEHIVIITVAEANAIPVIDPIDDITVSAGQRISFYVNVTDTDDISNMQYFIDPPMPPDLGDGGDILDRITGHFEWTPDREGNYTINVRVWDGHSDLKGNANQSFTITVLKNAIPVIDPIDDITVSAGQRISFYISATDEDTVGSLQYFVLDPLPPGVGESGDILDLDTGHFSWTPDENQTGTHIINLLVWDSESPLSVINFSKTGINTTRLLVWDGPPDDEGGRTQEVFTITVNGPVLAAIPTGITIPEHEEYTFDVDLAEGANVPAHTFVMTGGPSGANINPATGVFSWTPSEEQGGKSYTFTVAVMDSAGATAGDQEVTIKVNEANPPPVIEPIDDITVYLGQTLSFNVSATDIDTIGYLQYILLDPLPVGVDDTREILNWTTGHFDWTPDEDQTGIHTINLLVWDGQMQPHGRTRYNFNIMVTGDNPPPVIEPIDDIVVSPGQRISFYVNATDKGTLGVLRYIVLDPLPVGVDDTREILNWTTGHFDWTPDKDQTGVHTINLRVWDGQLRGAGGRTHEVFTITVNGPVLAPIPTGITIPEHIEYTFDADLAEGVNVPGHAFGLLDAPRGASIDPATGVFSWTPSEEQGRQSHTFTVIVMDSAGIIVGQQDVTIAVTEVNRPPIIERIGNIVAAPHLPITFDVNVIDTDTVNGGLRYIIDRPLPPGVSDSREILDRNTGRFNWTPNENQTGIHPINLRVWDGQSDSRGQTRQSFNITIVQQSDPPVIESIDDIAVTIGQEISFYVNATATHTFGGLRYVLDPPLPPGVSDSREILDRNTGRFNWTPNENQTGIHPINLRVWDGQPRHWGRAYESFTITVQGPILAPILTGIAIPEHEEYSFVAELAEGADVPSHTFALSSPTAGPTMDPATGRFSWTPSEDHGGNWYILTVAVLDGSGREVAAQSVRLLIIEANPSPVIEPIDDITAYLNQPVSFNVSATDIDTIGELRYIIDRPLPPGVSDSREILDRTTGHFNWTPDVAHMGLHTFNLRVWDGQSDSRGQTRQSFNIMVAGENPPPVVQPIRNYFTYPGEWIIFYVNAIDKGTIGELRYILDPPLPPGVEDGSKILNPATGFFDWTPNESQTGVHTFNVRVWDGQSDSRGQTRQSFNVTVLLRDAPQNTPPTAYNLPIIAVPLETRVINLATGTYIEDAEQEAKTLVVTIDGTSVLGNVSASGTTITYTAGSTTGTENIPYTVTDDGGLTAMAEIRASIVEGNLSDTIAPNSNETTYEDTALTVTPDIRSPDGGPIAITEVATYRGGTANHTATTVTYTPRPDFNGWDEVTYEVTHGGNQIAVGHINIFVTPVNDVPVISGLENMTINELKLLNITVAITDVESTTDQLTLTTEFMGAPGLPEGMQLTGERLTWTPTESQGPSTYTFIVRVSDGLNQTTREFAFTVDEVNQDPEFNITRTDHTAYLGMLFELDMNASDADIPEQTLVYNMTGHPAGATISGQGIFEWTPTADQIDNYTITITVSDGQGGSASQTFNVNVTDAVTAPPPDSRPNPDLVVPDILINAELFFPSAVTPAVADPAGGNVMITGVTGATLGILDTSMLPQILYTPNQTGIDRLNYTASDRKGGIDTGTITIFINPDGNARPVLEHIYNIGGRVGVNLEFTAVAVDDEVDPLTFDLANAPDGASITAGGDFSWKPTSSQNGTHTVTFIVYDDNGGADWQDVLITILRADETNLPPIPQDINADVVLGGGRGFQPDIADPENDGTEIVRVYDSSLGDVDRSFTSQGIIVYIAGVLGNDEVVYTVSDGRGGFANGTISITVEEPANVRPLIEFIGDKSINANNTLTFTVVARDLDGVVTGFDLAGAPEGASMTQQGIFSWAPTEDDVGRYEFAVIVFDDAGENNTESIAVTVRPTDYVNSPPVAPEVVIMTPQDVLSISRPTLTDPDEGDPVLISETGPTTKGRILSGFLRAGIIIYLPNQGESGTETVSYTAADSSNGNDTSTINIFISARDNTDPILGSIDFRNINAGQQLGFDLDAVDPDGGAISYQLVGAPDGTGISPEGAFSWTPAAADVGNHTFTIVAYDDRGGADSKSVVIRVLPEGTVNQPPNAPDSSVTVAAGDSIVITPAVSDPEGDRVAITDAVTSGTGVVIYSEDSMNYVHVSTLPTETITYTVTDARGATSTGTITVTVQ